MALVGAIVSAVCGGCGLLQGLGMAPSSPLFPCGSAAEPTHTTFASGSATVQFGSGEPATVTLAKIGDSTFMAGFDSTCPGFVQAEWTDARGDWTLTVLANADGQPSSVGGMTVLWIDRDDADPPLTVEGTSCTLTITDASSSGLAGHASCHGLRWVGQYDDQTGPDGPSPVPGYPPFDVTITFEARP